MKAVVICCLLVALAACVQSVPAGIEVDQMNEGLDVPAQPLADVPEVARSCVQSTCNARCRAQGFRFGSCSGTRCNCFI